MKKMFTQEQIVATLRAVEGGSSVAKSASLKSPFIAGRKSLPAWE